MKKIDFEFISMPDYFTKLLRSNMSISGDFYQKFPEYCAKNPSLDALIDLLFDVPEYSERIKFILKQFGFIGIRNRLAAGFLFYQQRGYYTKSPKMDIVDDLLNFEESFKEFAFENFSRVFLLAFYLKLSNIELHEFDVVKELLQEYGQGKIVKTDVMIVALYKMIELLGIDVVREAIDNQIVFSDFYKRLSDEQIKEFTESLLNYGMSISEKEIFSSLLV